MTEEQSATEKLDTMRKSSEKSEAFMTALQIATQARFPVFLWGMPGSGKTVNTEILGKALNEPLWLVTLSVREPTDQGGLPKLTDDGVELVPPRWAKQLHSTGHGIVFFDEFNTAEARLQASALRVVHEGYAGDLKLPSETSFIAAGNRPEKSAGALPLMSAMANRFVHIDWTPSIDGWCDGMISGFPTPDVVKLPSGWKRHVGEMQALIASFIRKNPEQLENEPVEKYLAGRAWQSRRTWRMASHLLAAAKAAGFDIKSRVAKILVEGCVGEGGYIEFGNYINKMDLRDPEEYLADPTGTPLPKTQDKIIVTANAVVAAALSDAYGQKARDTRQRIAWKVLRRLGEARGDDLLIPTVRVLAVNMEETLYNSLPDELDHFTAIMDQSEADFSKPVR